MATESLTTLGDIFKAYYIPAVQQMLNSESILLRMLGGGCGWDYAMSAAMVDLGFGES